MNRHVQPEDSDLYALGALDGEEKQALEAHLRECAECAREVEAARQRVALLGMAAPASAPPAWVKEELLRRVRVERAPQRTPVREEEKPRGFGFAWLTPAFGVAAVLFAALAAVLWMRDVRNLQRIHELEGQLAEVQTRSQDIARASEETDKLLEWPGTQRVALMPQPGMPKARAGVLYNPEMGMVAWRDGCRLRRSGKSYQLWLVPGREASRCRCTSLDTASGTSRWRCM